MGDFEDAVVVGVGDMELAGGRMDGDAVGAGEFAGLGIATEAGGAFFAGAGDALDFSCSGNVTTDDVVFGVGNEDGVVGVDAKVFGTVHGGVEGWAAVAGEAFFAGSIDNGADAALGVDDAEGVPVAFEDIEVARGIGGGGAGIGEGGFDGEGAVFGDAFLAITGDDFRGLGGEVEGDDLEEVGDVEGFAVGSEGDAVGAVATFFASGGFPTGEGADGLGFDVDFADDAVPGVGKEDVAVREDGEVMRAVEGGFEGGAVVAGVAGVEFPGDVGGGAVGGDFKGAVAGDHFDDPEVAAGVEAGAKGLLEVDFFGDLGDGFGVQGGAEEEGEEEAHGEWVRIGRGGCRIGRRVCRRPGRGFRGLV
jgi:hypothetical protein